MTSARYPLAKSGAAAISQINKNHVAVFEHDAFLDALVEKPNGLFRKLGGRWVRREWRLKNLRALS